MSERSGKERPAVLVVEQDRLLRDRFTAWLERADYEVMACPGPSRPEFRCIGFDRAGCPLAHGADVVVLDVWTAADAAFKGRGGFHLLRYYGGLGIPIVALRQSNTSLDDIVDGVVAEIEWPPDARELCETVGVALQLGGRSV